MSNLIGYARVSTDDQATNGHSLGAQVAALARWADANGHVLVGVEVDDGVSGGLRIESRPAGRRALAAMVEGRADGVIAVAQDRFYRDAVGWGLWVDAMNHAGKAIYLADRGPSPVTATSSDRMMAQVGAIFAEAHRTAIREHTTRAIRDLRSNGKVYGRNAPLTARRVGDMLVDDPKMIAAARFARDLQQKGRSLRAIGLELVDAGYLPRAAKEWHPVTVRSLIAQADGWRATQPGYSTTPRKKKGDDALAVLLQGGKTPKARKVV